tara:strand:- start:17295 stop:17777 length:483 start_codon:yes stop_codon:yes gene_type:complete
MKRQKSILVLDDEQDIGEIMLDILNPVYQEVVFCSSPIRAKELVAERSFSMILTDVQMPELPGPDFVKYVRSMGKIDPIIFVTGNATTSVLLSALRLGACDVVEKPFEPQDLLQTVERAFEIEKRRYQLYETIFTKKDNEKSVGGQKRMIGLLQVVNGKK